VSIELEPAAGFVERSVSEEFPGLRLCWTEVDASRVSSSPRHVRQRLHELSNRYHGASVIAMRTQAIPHAYRAFFRQIGLDPDVTRIPSEEAALARLLKGGFQSGDLLADALLIALAETGVAVWALNAELVDPSGLGIRTTVSGERFGSVQHRLPGGRLVVADGTRVHALLFGPVAPGHEPANRTKRVALFSVGVDGVPAIHVEEALWTAGEVLGASA